MTTTASIATTVTVACKLPHGLWLRRFKSAEEPEAQRDGTIKMRTIYREEGERFRINGNAMPAIRDPEKDYPTIVGGYNGYALTSGVPADLWCAWLEANKDTAMVRKGLVFACEKSADASQEAKRNLGVRTGLEPLAKDGDARMPRGISQEKAA